MQHGNEGVDAPEYGIPAPAHRLPAGTRVGRVRLQIAHLDRSLDYYCRVLGMRVLEHSSGGAVLGPAGPALPLIELSELPGATPFPGRGRPGLYHFAILLPSRAALGSFLRHLSDLGERAGASDHGVSEAVYLRDPDGSGIEVYRDRPRSAWRQRDRQLLMATEPLDVGRVLGAADAAGWQGMPAGTTMGHVHLHVGDLERAAGFYHEAIGLDKMVWSYPGALFLSAGGYHHHLGVNTWAAGAQPAGDEDAKLLEWELLVPSASDVERTLGSLEAAGHPVEQSGAHVWTRDPWGTRLRIRPAGTETAAPVEEER